MVFWAEKQKQHTKIGRNHESFAKNAVLFFVYHLLSRRHGMSKDATQRVVSLGRAQRFLRQRGKDIFFFAKENQE